MTVTPKYRLALVVVLMLSVASNAIGQSGPIDLGSLGGAFSIPYDMNDRGEVVGVSMTAEGHRHAFLWTAANGMMDLGTVGGLESGALAINESGQIVGWSDVPGVPPPGGAYDHAFSWTATGGMVDLGTLGGTSSQALYVNDRGEVFGWSLTGGNGTRHAFVWTLSDGMMDLGTLGGPISDVWGVNDRGQAVGDSWIRERSTPRHVFLWSATTGMVDLGALLGESTYASGINESGQVIGLRCTGEDDPQSPTGCNPFSWTAAAGLLDVGRLGSDTRGSTGHAYDLKDAGQVVGWSKTDEPIVGDEFGRHAVHAIVWTAAEGLVDLGTLGGPNSEALRVNEHGEVVGRSLIDGGLLEAWHAFMWTPTRGMVELRALSGRDYGQAFSINNNGQVIGVSYNNAPDADPRATMWLLSAPDDMTPPTLILSATIVVDGTGPAGATVTYAVSVTDDSDPTPVVACSPPSGSVFPLGVTTVSCTATDATGNSATGTFQVVVLNANQQLQETVDLLASYNLTRLGTSLSDKLQLAIRFNTGGDVLGACGVLTGFLHQVRAQTGKALTMEQAAELTRRAIEIQKVIGC